MSAKWNYNKHHGDDQRRCEKDRQTQLQPVDSRRGKSIQKKTGVTTDVCLVYKGIHGLALYLFFKYTF